ncbi:hypothetical protein A9G45_09295 [Gilliamella sp. HK2]|jgi:hypothetical protein|uniref:DUF3969 family protein n=1 Tax=unclassified Gilliamella TaxID=2685620 RepID=UPI00080E7801|nr:DUF3969 family protein [Gilliamella apicola]OCG24544.1 hypothetical protein A9G46_08820 [Gilliamella apicola]OCG27546.1 hypothetical protein A9G45_09295 [Gilliamella apicola]
MKLYYSIDKEQSEKFVDLFLLGTLYALKNKVISIDEAEGFIFTPKVSKLLSQNNFTNDLSNLIIDGCELEDYESLLPDKLDDRIDELIVNVINMIRKQPEFGRLINKNISIHTSEASGSNHYPK